MSVSLQHLAYARIVQTIKNAFKYTFQPFTIMLIATEEYNENLIKGHLFSWAVGYIRPKAISC